MLLKTFLVVQYLFLATNAYKIAIFNPQVSGSQVMYSKRIAETLAEGGHDVTLLMVQYFTDFDVSNEIKVDKRIKIHHVDGSSSISQKEMHASMKESTFKDLPVWHEDSRKEIELITEITTSSCRKILEQKEFLKWLENENFDVAFAHILSMCPIGIIHLAKIPSWIWYSSGMIMDHQASMLGVPTVPSYVPPVMMASQDRMTFIERTKSVLGHGLMQLLYPSMIANVETQMFRDAIDPNFPDLIELAEKCPLATLNTNDLYDFSRPTLAKVVAIGGLGMQTKDAKPLTGDFASIAARGKPMIVMSFGSVAPAHHMPKEWKKALMGAFGKLKEYEFLMRYIEKDMDDIKPPNVYLSKWLPQSDLLQHNQTKAFISHGGYNSLQEVISAGKPIITIALFGDQPKNAQLALKHGIAVNLEKSLVSEESVYNAIKEITENKKYSDNAVRLRRMVQQQPIKPETLLIRWTEFVAEFKTLENLEPAGQYLNFIQYHSIDVYLFLSSIVLTVIVLVYLLVRFLIRRVCSLVYIIKYKVE